MRETQIAIRYIICDEEIFVSLLKKEIGKNRNLIQKDVLFLKGDKF